MVRPVSLISPQSRFATTQWSLVFAASEDEHQRHRQALEDLCRCYWYPLYAYARRRGFDAEEAADVTQAFFADLLERQSLQEVAPDKGKFRAFLLAAFRNFMAQHRARHRTVKRGGGTQAISIDADAGEERFQREPADALTPEDLFERRWGLTVMERAMEKLREQQERRGRPEAFTALQPYLTHPDNAPYRELANQLQWSLSAVKVAIHRLRQAYGEWLRAEIARTVADPNQVDEELRYLLTQLRPWQS